MDVNAQLVADHQKLDKGNENMENALKDTEDANNELLKKRAKMGSFNKLLKWVVFLFLVVSIMIYNMFFWADEKIKKNTSTFTLLFWQWKKRYNG